jgi:CxxC motif-containing protein (DUF1111 family)
MITIVLSVIVVFIYLRSLPKVVLACCLVANCLGPLIAEGVTQNEFAVHRKSVQPSNADSCASCHAVPVVGGSSNVTVARVEDPGIDGGRTNSSVSHATRTSAFPTQSAEGNRLTISLMGDGYIEVVDDREIKAALDRQRSYSKNKIDGHLTAAPTLETAGTPVAIGKFGWKAQHSSLYSACADSMLNELGVPNRIYSAQSTPRAEDNGALGKMVAFVRSLPPPERDLELAATEDSVRGKETFSHIGCALCHVPTMKTFPAGTIIDGGAYRVPEQLGSKEFHPYSDFLLHDVGTGDGIVQAAKPEFMDPETANRFRTPPLWGLRYGSWLMHDGKSVTLHQAIMRHTGEASNVVSKYEELSPKERHELDQFLNSL